MAIFEYSPADDAVRETIDFAGEDPTDVYLVELTVGVDYAATVLGTSSGGGNLQDPYINIYDSEGNLVTSADNSSLSGIPTALQSMIDFPIPGGLNLDPSLIFQVPSHGVYQIEVGDRAGIGGDYTFNLDQAGIPTWLTGNYAFDLDQGVSIAPPP